MSQEQNPYEAPKSVGGRQRRIRLRMPRWLGFIVGLSLVVVQCYWLPDLVAIAQQPYYRSAFEVTASWWLMYASPFVILFGIGIIAWSFQRRS